MDGSEPCEPQLPSLPRELQLACLAHLPTIHDRLALRAVSRGMRALTSLPEGWADYAAIRWASVQQPPFQHIDDTSIACGEVRLATAWLSGATLADVCARIVAWPSRLCLRPAYRPKCRLADSP